MSNYTAYERETVCTTNDEERTWTIETYMASVIGKMTRAGIQPTSIREDGQHVYKNVPFSQVSFRAESSRKGKPLSEVQKQKMQAGREAKKQK